MFTHSESTLQIKFFIYTRIISQKKKNKNSSCNIKTMFHKLESRLPGEIAITSDMQMTPPLWQKVKKN